MIPTNAPAIRPTAHHANSEEVVPCQPEANARPNHHSQRKKAMSPRTGAGRKNSNGMPVDRRAGWRFACTFCTRKPMAKTASRAPSAHQNHQAGTSNHSNCTAAAVVTAPATAAATHRRNPRIQRPRVRAHAIVTSGPRAIVTRTVARSQPSGRGPRSPKSAWAPQPTGVAMA